MGLGAGLFLGWQAVGVVKDLFGFFDAINATTEEDLDKAAQRSAAWRLPTWRSHGESALLIGECNFYGWCRYCYWSAD